MEYPTIGLQFFAEEAGAAPEAGNAEAGTAAETGAEEVAAGEALADGTEVPNARVAAALNRQMKRHPELRQVYGQNQAKQAGPGQTPEEGPSIDERWDELRRGEFREQYARDVQNAIRERFKNQEDLSGKLNAMQPMLDALMKKTGAESVEELQSLILDDDSLYEDEAEAAGMSVSAYKSFKKLQEEHDQAIAREQQNREKMALREHIMGLVQQGEELKKTFPDFNFDTEVQNPVFRRLTGPEVGLSVADAYFAIHRNELTPQLMGYGMRRAQSQMAQTLQAQQMRPAEGAMRNQGQAADVRLNPAKLTRKEREEIKRQVRLGKVVSFD